MTIHVLNHKKTYQRHFLMKSKNNASFVLSAIASSLVAGRCLLPLELTIQRGLPLESVKDDQL